MAIDYTALFTDIGKLVKAANLFALPAISGGIPDYPTLLEEIRTAIQTPIVGPPAFSGREIVIEGLEVQFNELRDTSTSEATGIGARVDVRLQHKETILDELDVVNLSINEIIFEIIRDMFINTESIEKRNCGLGTLLDVPHARVTNLTPTNTIPSLEAGKGTLSATLHLDGVTAPSPGWPTNIRYAKGAQAGISVLSELVVDKEITVFTCISDQSTGSPEGEEIFRGQTDNSGINDFDWRALNLDRGNKLEFLGSPGSGGSLDLTTVQAGTILSNMNFESFSTNVPESWTIVSGDTNISQETTPADVHRGDSALRLVTAAELFQEFIPGSLVANRQYLFGFWLRSAAVTTGRLIINIQSPSGEFFPLDTVSNPPPRNFLNAEDGGEIDLDLTGYGTNDYVWNEGWWITPPIVPDDLRMVITYTGGDGEIWIDSMGFGPVTFLGGVGYIITADKVPYVLEDRFEITNGVITDDLVDGGVFQKFIGRRFHQQLPSAEGPTQPDSLAI